MGGRPRKPHVSHRRKQNALDDEEGIQSGAEGHGAQIFRRRGTRSDPGHGRGSRRRCRPRDRRQLPDLVERVHVPLYMSDEIFIRLLDDEIGFRYSVRRGAKLIESAVVHPTGSPSYGATLYDDYYNGSMAMD